MDVQDLINLNTLSGEGPGYQGDPDFYTPYYPPSTGNTNYGEVDPPSTGIGGPGTSYTQNPDGTVTVNPDTGGGNDTTLPSGLPSGLSNIFNSLFGDGRGGLDLLKLGALGGGALSLFGGNKSSSTPSGYQGSIPKYTATRNMVTAPEAGRRPGAGGTRYGGDVTFAPKGSVPTGGGIASLIGGDPSNAPPGIAPPGIAPQIPGSEPPTPGQRVAQDDPFYQSPEFKAYQNDQGGALHTMDMYMSPYFGSVSSGSAGRAMDRAYEQYKNKTGGGAPTRSISQQYADVSAPMNENQTFAEGGSTGRYLQGETDGMADEIPAQIGEDQPAALSHGEFVIPADVVSHLGNGNSDAGAQRLYDMMDKIREARTGTKKQGKEINPDSFMPGGLAKAYAAGGEVQRFQTGGVSGLGTAANAGVTGTESNLSSWAGPYVTDMLGKGQALSEMPYQEYGGPLTAGASGLQNKVFGGLQNTNFPGTLGQSFSSTGAYQAPAMNMDAYKTQPIGTGPQPGATVQPPGIMGSSMVNTQANQPQGIASQYMNPYLQSVLTPQLEELRRQNEITNMGANAKLTSAGAFGGGRQAIMNAENNRNLMQEMNKTVGQGYANAYDKGMQQFNTEQGQGMGLANLMAGQGAVERGIESEGITADKTAFEEARANPYKMVQFQQSLLSGLPLAAQNINTAQPSTFSNVLTGAGSVASLLNTLGLGPKKG
jgi:hypothetical protein